MISHAFLRLDSASREDLLTDAAVNVLAAEGAVGLTLRAVADWLQVTPARVSQMVSRDELPYLVAARFAQRWSGWIEYQRWRHGVHALLPAEPDEIAGVRVWLALTELARSRSDVADVLELSRDRERAALADIDGVTLEPDQMDLVLATADGLHLGLCRVDGLTIPDARKVLSDLLAHLEVSDVRPRSA
jgi:hypothetical protein